MDPIDVDQSKASCWVFFSRLSVFFIIRMQGYYTCHEYITGLEFENIVENVIFLKIFLCNYKHYFLRGFIIIFISCTVLS
jgi:hypothetical protein